jgi:protein-disulfide isomerase
MVFLLVSLFVTSDSSWSASTKQEIRALREEVAEMQKDLAEIKRLLKDSTRVAAPKANVTAFKEQVMSIGSSPFKGQADATVTLVEFSDYQCPYCARNYREVMPELLKQYAENGKLKYVMRENPIPSLHRDAVQASLAALCAKEQGSYWEMHDMLFDNQQQLSTDRLKAYAAYLGLNAEQFDPCLDFKKYQQQITADIASGKKLGVRGTPGFVLGLTDPDDPDKAYMSIFIKGAQPLATFRQAIDGLLQSVEEKF